MFLARPYKKNVEKDINIEKALKKKLQLNSTCVILESLLVFFLEPKRRWRKNYVQEMLETWHSTAEVCYILKTMKNKKKIVL